jgi:hypothetical protein
MATNSRTPAPPRVPSTQSNIAAAAALHPSLGVIGLNQHEQQLRDQLNAGSSGLHPSLGGNPDSIKLMNMFLQQQQQQNAAGREMAKKSDSASSLRVKEEERQRQQSRPNAAVAQQRQQQQQQQQQAQFQAQQQQAVQQQLLAAMAGLPQTSQNMPNNYVQSLPAATQFMLQQMLSGQQQQAPSIAIPPGFPDNFLGALTSRPGQFPQQNQNQSRPQMQQLQQRQAAATQQQQMAVNFAQQQLPAVSNQRGLDQNQLLALSLLQQQQQQVGRED